MNDKIQYWFDLADEDVKVAKHLLAGNMFLYCGFMCHLAVEKSIKAVIAKSCVGNEIPPKWHDLLRLSERANLLNELNEKQKLLLRNLNPLQIEARYPEHKRSLSAEMTYSYCQILIQGTEEFLCWIKEQL